MIGPDRVNPVGIEQRRRRRAIGHGKGRAHGPIAPLQFPVQPGVSAIQLVCRRLAAALGGLGFAFTGALGAALALGAKRGGLLIAVVVLPLFIPPVVFGAGALTRAANGQDPLSALALLGAYVLFAIVIAPVAGAAAIRNAQG